MASPTLPRRSFLAACAAIPLAGACARLTYVQGRLDGDRIAVAKTALDADGYALVEVAQLEHPVYVQRQGADEYTAVLTRCMHRGCTVEPEGARLVCPCHGSEYSTVGALLKGPAERPLIRFHVTTDATHIYVHDAVRSGRNS